MLFGKVNLTALQIYDASILADALIVFKVPDSQIRLINYFHNQ